MSSKGQHVVPSGEMWSVRRAGSSRASGIYPTKKEAIEKACEIAQNQGANLYIHGRDGRIVERRIYAREASQRAG